MLLLTNHVCPHAYVFTAWGRGHLPTESLYPQQVLNFRSKNLPGFGIHSFHSFSVLSKHSFPIIFSRLLLVYLNNNTLLLYSVCFSRLTVTTLVFEGKELKNTCTRNHICPHAYVFTARGRGHLPTESLYPHPVLDFRSKNLPGFGIHFIHF